VTSIEAIIRPSSLEAVVEALDHHQWIKGITVSEVKGYGRQKGHLELYRGAEYIVDMNPKVKVQVVVPDPLVPRVLHDLERCLRTGRIGDGKIFVTRIDDAVRVRTGERGEAAL
jgi:nitrogen regulatory protein P-II 1